MFQVITWGDSINGDTPTAGWFIYVYMETCIKMDDLRVPPLKTCLCQISVEAWALSPGELVKSLGACSLHIEIRRSDTEGPIFSEER